MPEKPTYEELESRVRQLGADFKASKNKYHHFFEQALLPYLSLDLNGNFLKVNEFLKDTLGYKEEELIVRNSASFLTSDQANHFKSTYPEVKVIDKVLGSEFEMRQKDGTV